MLIQKLEKLPSFFYDGDIKVTRSPFSSTMILKYVDKSLAGLRQGVGRLTGDKFESYMSCLATLEQSGIVLCF